MYVADVLPLVIKAIQDAASPDKRIVAVKALRQVRAVCMPVLA